MADISDQTYQGKKAVIVGGGIIGASWAILFLVNRLSVTICDPDTEIEAKVLQVFNSAAPSLKGLGFEVAGVTSRLTFVRDIAEAVVNVSPFIQTAIKGGILLLVVGFQTRKKMGL
ncbi:hypothetical protein HFO93_19900 [Rhizobium leguminosarum]|uniref:3-hydroxyacyl-CoA dehydrogenase NAD-binding domain-containing protein n=1 Tax=Rhizobium leguminosarum TaxID=384 RepID=UPI001C98AF0E|nr:3-hydroxyacyl-CoA dehydrogenase NAD-binding domain-containing protein [Rhizobium leguminosarum]MBY5445703.1 hypothetical protein [Rhizobium leguminosarum]